MVTILAMFAWDVEVKTDPMTDQEDVFASVKSKDVDRYGQQSTLYVRCMDGQFDVFVATTEVLEGSLNDELSAVWRFDKHPAERGILSEVGQTSAFFGGRSHDIAARLRTADKFLIELPVYPDSSRVFEFDVAGAHDGINQVAGACGVVLPGTVPSAEIGSSARIPDTPTKAGPSLDTAGQATELCVQVAQMIELSLPTTAILEGLAGATVTYEDLRCLAEGDTRDEVLVWAVESHFAAE